MQIITLNSNYNLLSASEAIAQWHSINCVLLLFLKPTVGVAEGRLKLRMLLLFNHYDVIVEIIEVNFP